MPTKIQYDLSTVPPERRLELELRIIEVQARQREAFWAMVQGFATIALLFGLVNK